MEKAKENPLLESLPLKPISLLEKGDVSKDTFSKNELTADLKLIQTQNKEVVKDVEKEKESTSSFTSKYNSIISKQLVEIQEDELISAQIKEAVIITTLENESQLLSKEQEINEELKTALSKEKSQLEREIQNANIVMKELQLEMNSIGQIIEALKDHFSMLEENYKDTSNNLITLNKYENDNVNEQKKLYEQFESEIKMEKEKSEKKLNCLEHENEELSLKIKNFEEKINFLQKTYAEKGNMHSTLEEEYKEESNKCSIIQEELKVEESLNEELKRSAKSIDLDDLISKKREKEEEIKLNLEVKEGELNNISNRLMNILENSGRKKGKIDDILKEISQNNEYIDQKENEISQLEKKIKEYDFNINKMKNDNYNTIKKLQEQIQLTRNKLNEITEEYKKEVQNQDIFKMNFEMQKNKEKELAKEMEKYLTTKTNLSNENDLFMAKLSELKKMQEELKENLMENKTILSMLEKENDQVEIEEQKIEEDIKEMDLKYEKMREEYQNKLAIINGEIEIFAKESEKAEKERRQKVNKIMNENREEAEKLKKEMENAEKITNEIQEQIEKRERMKNVLRGRKETLENDIRILKKGSGNVERKTGKGEKRARKTKDVNEQQQPDGILKKKKVTFSTKPDTVRTISFESDNSSKNEEKSLANQLNRLPDVEELFQMLKEEDDNKKKSKRST